MVAGVVKAHSEALRAPRTGGEGPGRGRMRCESNLRRICVADKTISTPEAWIGDDIIVLIGESSETLTGPLLEVNDRGIVIDNLLNLEELEERRARGEEREALRQEMKFVDMFIPWHRISSISRSRA